MRHWLMAALLLTGCGQVDEAFSPDFGTFVRDPFQLQVQAVMEPSLAVLRQYRQDKDAWLESVKNGLLINDQPAKWATTVPNKDVLKLTVGDTPIGYLVAPHGFAGWDLPEIKAQSAFWQTFGYTVDGIPSGGLVGFTALSISKKLQRLPQVAPADADSPLAFRFTEEVPSFVKETLDALLTQQSQKIQARDPWMGALDPFPGIFEIRYADQVVGYVSESYALGGKKDFSVVEAFNLLDRQGHVRYAQGRQVSPNNPSSYRRFAL